MCADFKVPINTELYKARADLFLVFKGLKLSKAALTIKSAKTYEFFKILWLHSDLPTGQWQETDTQGIGLVVEDIVLNAIESTGTFEKVDVR